LVVSLWSLDLGRWEMASGVQNSGRTKVI
jgi:hypothetical protein